MAQPPALLTYSDLERFAIAIAKSELFGIKTPEQALALMLIAQAEGRHPALAARDYDVIQGRPSKKAEAMLRDFLDAGGKVEWHALDDTTAEATFSHPAGGTVRIKWDTARATKAELMKNAMWKKYPRQMLRSRTVSEGVRTVCPLATSGMYEPGEVSDMAPVGPVDGQGRPDPMKGATIEGEAPAVTAPPIDPARGGKGTRLDADGRPYDANPAAYTTPPDPPPPPPPVQHRTARTMAEWLDAFELAANDLTGAEAADQLITSRQALWMKEYAIGNAKARFDGIVAGVMQTWFSAGADDPPPPDPD